MKKLFCVCIMLLLGEAVHAQVSLRPFPQHNLNTSGSIKPSLWTQAQLDADVEKYYDQWKIRFLKQGCDGYYVDVTDAKGGTGGVLDGPPNTMTVSEAHGYGMLIAALMAGYDAKAKINFDGMVNFYRVHPPTAEHSADHYLMDWLQEKTCLNSKSAGLSSAADGDLDIAFALLLADKQWGSAGAVDYLAAAKNIINNIMTSEINPKSWSIMCGDDFTWDKDHYYGTRSSDFMIDHLRTFQIVTNDDRWNNVINETYHVINTIQTHESLSTGLLPDFIYHCDTIPMPVWNEKKPAYLETEWDGAYFWNACRFPWRLGTDYLVSGDTRSLNALNKINAWIEKETEGNPDNICEGYKLDGTCLDKFEGHASIAFVATFAVSAMADARYQSWLNTLWSYTLAHGDQPNQYYDDTIKMICLIVMSGNWWQPSYQRIESIAKTK